MSLNLFGERDRRGGVIFAEARNPTAFSELSPFLKGERNKRWRQMDGERFLGMLPAGCAAAAFFDPQYRGILDAMSYGNEGEFRSKRRSELPQMDNGIIARFLAGIDSALVPSGHLFLWVDKFELHKGSACAWLEGTDLEVVDMIVWDKRNLGMGYRSRRQSEYCVVAQKRPVRVKGCWTRRDIPDVWPERAEAQEHPHAKPVHLQEALIRAATGPEDLVIDPAAGSFSVLEAARSCGRNFLGCEVTA